MIIYMDAADFSEKLTKLLSGNYKDSTGKIKNNIQRKIREHKGLLLLFGAGELGRKTADTLTKHVRKPIAFIDNNQSLYGSEIGGIPIISLDEAIKKYSEALIVVTVFTNNPILKELKSSGIEAISFTELAWCYPEWFLPFCYVEYPDKIYSSKSEILKMASLWADDESKNEFERQIEWRITLDSSVLPPHHAATETYFPGDLFKISENEVFVDCGSYDGDSIKEFIRRSDGKFRHIVAVEPDPGNRRQIETWKEGLAPDQSKKITVISEAASDHEGMIQFDAQGTVTSSVGSGKTLVPCARLDLSIHTHHPTFIKMDIEGAEPFALSGASKIIQNDQPILAVCLYHAQSHLWEIPLFIHKLNSSYKFFLRRYSDECWETVCYAIPPGRSIL